MQIFKVIFLSVIGISIVILAVFWASWKRPEYFLNVNESAGWDNFINVSNQNNSYFRELDNLVIFNCTDTRNPDDTPVKQLEEKWSSLKPDIVLIEGTLGFFLPGLMNPVKKFGISGLAYQLASENNIKVYKYSLPVGKIIEKLLKKFPPEQIAVTLALHSYNENSKYGKSLSNDEFIREYFSKLRYTELNVALKSARDIDRIWERDFSQLKSWRTMGVLPGYIGEIAREVNSIRNKHLLCLIDHFTGQNKKVLVVNHSDSLPARKNQYAEIP